MGSGAGWPGRTGALSIIECRAAAETAQAVDVLCDAFHNYPVMRYVIGPVGADYDRHLRTLIGFFVQARQTRGEPVLGVAEGDTIVAAALVTLPGSGSTPAQLAAHREVVWSRLGAEARTRYEAYGTAARTFEIDQPHHHLNMIGVRRSHAGQGLGRRLLGAVHEMASKDPGSSGVSLTTEVGDNVGLYEHFGYQVTGHVRVSPALETWGMFRADDG